MAARLNELRGFLSVCGINNTGPTNARQTTELITSQGFTSIDDFNGFKQADVGRLVKAFNTGNPVSGTIGFMSQKKLEALAFWVTDLKKRGLTPTLAEWNNDAVEKARIESDITSERKANPVVPKRCDKIVTGLDWYTWSEKFDNYLSSIRGVDDVPLSYVTRRPKPAGWDPVTDANSPEETLIYQVALNGSAFEQDNKTVFTKILEVTLGEPAYEWIRSFEQTKDGRGAMEVLRQHCEGSNFTELRVNEADRILRETVYNNERHFSFESYSTLLQKEYTIYEQTGQVYPDRAKVRRLIDKMSVGNSLVLSHAKEHVIDNMPNDWVQAVNYMKTKVAQAFPGAQAPRSTRRFVNEVNCGRGRGRGRG